MHSFESEINTILATRNDLSEEGRKEIERIGDNVRNDIQDLEIDRYMMIGGGALFFSSLIIFFLSDYEKISSLGGLGGAILLIGGGARFFTQKSFTEDRIITRARSRVEEILQKNKQRYSS